MKDNQNKIELSDHHLQQTGITILCVMVGELMISSSILSSLNSSYNNNVGDKVSKDYTMMDVLDWEVRCEIDVIFDEIMSS